MRNLVWELAIPQMWQEMAKQESGRAAADELEKWSLRTEGWSSGTGEKPELMEIVGVSTSSHRDGELGAHRCGQEAAASAHRDLPRRMTSIPSSRPSPLWVPLSDKLQLRAKEGRDTFKPSLQS